MIPRQSIAHLRTFGIVAHVDAGKTTLTERLLHETGRIHAVGSVDAGNTVTDHDPRERKRGITIGAAAVTMSHRGHQLTVVDTPGHVDFGIEVERCLRVLDGAIVVLDAVAGVEPQTEAVWDQADRFRLPRIVLINKIDRPGADMDAAVASLERTFGVCALPLVVSLSDTSTLLDVVRERAIDPESPRGRALTPKEASRVEAARSALVERLAELDATLLEAFLEEQVISSEAMCSAIRRVTLRRSAVPILCGSAKVGLGVHELLDAVVDYLPAPNERDSDERHPPGKLLAYAFKSANDAFGSRTFIRVYEGSLNKGQVVRNSRTQRNIRVGRILRPFGDHGEEVESLGPGEIAAVLGLPIVTGDTICDPEHPVTLEGLRVPESVVALALEPANALARQKLGPALGRLVTDDPSLRLTTNEETGQTLLSGLGELHLEVAVDKLRDDYHVEVRASAPRVAYRETLLKSARGEARFVKQKGGPGYFGHVQLSIEPLPRGAGFSFADVSVGGVVPKVFVPAVEAGAKEALSAGTLAGYPIVDVHVALLGGSYHENDSNEIAFATAARLACLEAIREADPAFLEPLMRVEVTTPEPSLGEVIGDLGARRGRILTLAHQGVRHLVTALVPLSSLLGYAGDLRSRTQGRAMMSMRFAHYELVPAALFKAIPRS